MVNTARVSPKDPWSVSDWSLLGYEFSRASSNQSETPHGSLLSYVISMKFSVPISHGLERGKNLAREEEIQLFTHAFHLTK